MFRILTALSKQPSRYVCETTQCKSRYLSFFAPQRSISLLHNSSINTTLSKTEVNLRRSTLSRAPGFQAVVLTGARWSSSSTGPSGIPADLSNLPAGYIPEPPMPLLLQPDVEVIPQLTALGEPTLQSLGLATWWPNGVIQWALEAVHVSLDIPWWGAIALTTLCLRLLMFPLVVFAQRNSANMHNHMPIVQAHQQKFQKARMSGNPLEAARAGSEYMDYMKKNNVSPIKSMLFPMAQVPVFLAVFIGIRQMANLPVQSMTTGGMLWFTDLTITDPYWALPLLTSATFLATMELGVDGVKATSLSTTARTIMRAMPIVLFPLILNFPTAMLCYWFTSNVISLFQVLMLRIPAVKSFCKIPALVTHDPELVKKQKQPFFKSIKENYKSSKNQVSMEDRLRDEAVKFKQAGLGAIQKTYDYDPTKVRHKTSGSTTTTAVSKSGKSSAAS